MASKTYEFTMAMTCEGCANAAKKVLGKKVEVTAVVTDLDTKTVLVTSTLSSDDLLQTLEKTGKAIEFVGEK